MAEYQSPFSWRYATGPMRELWSEEEKRRRWRQGWVALAQAQQLAGLTTQEQVTDLQKHVANIDIERAHQIEAETRHDVMAEIRAYAEQATVGGGIIHLGATSMDITDNAEVTRQRDALDLTLVNLRNLLMDWAKKIEQWADVPTMGWTHLQPAEPTTVGYRLAGYAQDLFANYQQIKQVRLSLRGKGLKGAVGSRASYMQLVEATDTTAEVLEQHFMQTLGLNPFLITTQTYPRQQDLHIVSALAALAGTLYRFGFDLRLLQSPPIGEWSEPFGSKQVGSSAMPFKRNPINAEKLDSLGRYVATLPRVLWDNAAHSLLERTLDDSANRRMVIPEAFLAVDEMLRVTKRVLNGLIVDERRVQINMERYGLFAATERILMALGRAGANRQEMHERIREHSMVAWAALRDGKPNPLKETIRADIEIGQYLPQQQIDSLMDATTYIGDTPGRARQLAELIRGGLA